MTCGAAISSIHFESGALVPGHSGSQVSYSCERVNTISTQSFESMFFNGRHTAIGVLRYQNLKSIRVGSASMLTSLAIWNVLA